MSIICKQQCEIRWGFFKADLVEASDDIKWLILMCSKSQESLKAYLIVEFG